MICPICREDTPCTCGAIVHDGVTSIPLDWIENKVKEYMTAYKESFLPWDDPSTSNWPDNDLLRNALKDAFLLGRESMPNYDAAVASVRQEVQL